MVGTSPTMTERAVFMGSGLRPAACPGMTTSDQNPASPKTFNTV
jgi:hypothetical protein